MECMSIGFVCIYAVLAVLWFIALNFLTFQKCAESVAVSGRLAGVIKSVVGIGKYISLNSRKGFWGKGAVDAISEKLQRQLPGLRGYSSRNLRNMRQFYEEWILTILIQSSL